MFSITVSILEQSQNHKNINDFVIINISVNIYFVDKKCIFFLFLDLYAYLFNWLIGLIETRIRKSLIILFTLLILLIILFDSFSSFCTFIDKKINLFNHNAPFFWRIEWRDVFVRHFSAFLFLLYCWMDTCFSFVLSFLWFHCQFFHSLQNTSNKELIHSLKW